MSELKFFRVDFTYVNHLTFDKYKNTTYTANMDTHNPAVAKHLNIPPKLLEEVSENPAVLQPVARVMGVVNLHNMFMQVSHPDATFNQRAEFQKLVNKIGKLEPETGNPGAGNGFSLKIVLNGDQTVSLHAAPQPQPIESTAIELQDE